ncbi:MAG TPA: RluA family pseudouridine synthase [Candidatus Marinimicrobia bacterium]|nr:RluA family pseudouridine synthase [Candidatus Neomarinimicrobiota bacterium]
MNFDQLKILYEDNHLLVLCKPPGMLVQGDQTGDPTLLEMAKAYIKKVSNKPGNAYLGLVHRLDRPASGVIVFARTSKAAGRLMKQFQQRQIGKIYHCLAEGEIPLNGEWLDRIERHGVTSVISAGEPNAVLCFKRLQFKAGVSQAEVQLLSGKHHQIRVQFASRGFPLLGDFRYGSKIKFPNRSIALHARSLHIIHPIRQEPLIVSCDVPKYWCEYV